MHLSDSSKKIKRRKPKRKVRPHFSTVNLQAEDMKFESCSVKTMFQTETGRSSSGGATAFVGASLATIFVRGTQLNRVVDEPKSEPTSKQPKPVNNDIGATGALEREADSDSAEMLSFLWILRSWLLECTAHGVPKMISAANFHRKIFWLISVILCATCFVWQITDMYIDVSRHPMTVNLQIYHREQLELPMVTICNSNKFKESMIRAYDPESDIYKVISFENLNLISFRSIYEELLSKLEENEASAKNSTSKDGTSHVNPDSGSDPNADGEQIETIDRCEGNEFRCIADSSHCIKGSWMCDSYKDCQDDSDESTDLCGSCPMNKFQCSNGQCISPKLRCNSVVDCSDGSDEDEEFCDPEASKDFFACCATSRKVPLENVCDSFDDCPREKSDEYLDVCPEYYNGTVLLKCPQPNSPYFLNNYIYITQNQINDGVDDCLFGMDEICSWKQNRQNWEPLRELTEYLSVLGNPTAMRWYEMANASLVEQLGHKYEDVVLQCRSNNKPCNESVIVNQTLSQRHGNCFSFTQKTPITTSGQTYGLNVWFNLEVYETLGLFTENSGLKMYFTNPGWVDQYGSVYVDRSSEIGLMPGYEHLITVQPRLVKKLTAPFSSCENYRKGRLANFNTLEDCLFDCSSRQKAVKCGCVDDLKYQLAPLCTLNQSEQRACVDDINENFNLNSECDCPYECVARTYDFSVTQLEWPTNRSITPFIAQVYENLASEAAVKFMVSAFENYLNNPESEDTILKFRTNFGSFKVYFRELSETIVEERPVYNPVLILSTFGGLLGLYLGFSVLTVLELFDFCFDFIEFTRMKGKQLSHKKYVAERVSLKDENTFEASGVADSQHKVPTMEVPGLENVQKESNTTASSWPGRSKHFFNNSN